MSDLLEQVIGERRADVLAARERTPERDLLAYARPNLAGSGPGDAFTRALAARRCDGRLGVIAEVKRWSPALGALGVDVDPAAQARRYAAAGATAISVLTEPRHWRGSFRDLELVRASVDVPVLCKDVIVSEYQLAEARTAGADAVLLVAEALSDAELARFRERAAELSMGALVEAHEPAAFARAVASGALVVGANARDLRRPGEIDPRRARVLRPLVHDDQVFVAESGIASVDDARSLPSRVDAVLVGTALMRAADPTPLVQALGAISRSTAGAGR